jgi:ATP-dependent Clp protease ATP-binding subunit ClpC
MFERFTEGAIKAIMLAQEEGRRLGHNYVDTEQLMLGLIGEGTGIAAKSLKASGVSLKEARAGVEAKIGRGNDFVLPGQPWYLRWTNLFKGMSDCSFKPRAQKVLELSWDEARKLKHNFIGTEHLLLGLICEARDSLETEGSQGVAVQTLQTMGIDLIVLETKTLELIGQRER